MSSIFRKIPLKYITKNLNNKTLFKTIPPESKTMQRGNLNKMPKKKVASVSRVLIS